MAAATVVKWVTNNCMIEVPLALVVAELARQRAGVGGHWQRARWLNQGNGVRQWSRCRQSNKVCIGKLPWLAGRRKWNGKAMQRLVIVVVL